MTIELVRFHDDENRFRVDSLMRDVIREPTSLPMESTSWEAESGFDSLVLGALDGDSLVGGIWVSPPHQDLRSPHVRRWQPDMRSALMMKFVMLHHIAVAPAYQGRGVGRRLVQEAANYVRRQRKLALYGVSDPRVSGFYRAVGFRVAQPGDSLFLALGPRAASFDLAGGSSWFAMDCQVGATSFRFGSS